MVCFGSYMAQGLHWCHEDLVSRHFSALPHAMLASFPGFPWWPWKLQTQILLTASRPRGKHDAFLPLVPWKSSLALIRLRAPLHSPNLPKQLLGLENSAFWLAKHEVTSVPPLSPHQCLLEPGVESTLPKAQGLRAGDGASRARLGCYYLKKDLWMLGGKIIDVYAEYLE